MGTKRRGPGVKKWTWWHRWLMRRWCKKHFWNFGPGAEVRPGAYIIHPENIWLGDGVVVRDGCMLFADDDAGIFIDRKVLLSPGVKIFVNNHAHHSSDTPIIDQGYDPSECVSILRGAWIGCDAIILPGVTIGYNAVVGAGSVVTKNVPDGEVWAGNHARRIKAKASGSRRETVRRQVDVRKQESVSDNPSEGGLRRRKGQEYTTVQQPTADSLGLRRRRPE